jgi:hypothetical protein
MKLLETGKAEDTPDYISGDAHTPPLLFTSEELALIRRTLSLPS